jgi:hypothetical protein
MMKTSPDLSRYLATQKRDYLLFLGSARAPLLAMSWLLNNVCHSSSSKIIANGRNRRTNKTPQ